ncbi:MAG: hypothetical protein KDB14_02965, partial [Planctomycetales bacterium]|nr:hypothetical protein [Planctomycetales bacterium]
MTPSDLDGCLALSDEAGWNQLRGDWERVLAYEPQGCFVASHTTSQREARGTGRASIAGDPCEARGTGRASIAGDPCEARGTGR